MLVSNAEYYAFVEDGGYTTRAWWCEKGWSWAQGKTKPLLWSYDDSKLIRTQI